MGCAALFRGIKNLTFECFLCRIIMDNNKKNGNWLKELFEELKLSLVISYLELFVTCADTKEYVQKNKDNLTPAALNKREMKKVKAAPWLNFFGSLFFLLAVGSVVASFVLHMTLSPLVFVAADVLFVILVVMLPVSAKRKEVCKNPADYEDMLYISLTGLGFTLATIFCAIVG